MSLVVNYNDHDDWFSRSGANLTFLWFSLSIFFQDLKDISKNVLQIGLGNSGDPDQTAPLRGVIRKPAVFRAMLKKLLVLHCRPGVHKVGLSVGIFFLQKIKGSFCFKSV